MMTPAVMLCHAPLERLAALLIGIVFLSSLLLHAVGWDWLFDTAYLIAALYVAVPRSVSDETSQLRLLLVSLYLCIESALQTLVAVCSPGAMLMVFMALTGLYSVALARRLQERGLAPGLLPWRALFRAPAMRITLGAAVPLACLYMPMLHAHHPDPMWSGPMVVTFGHTSVMNAGHAIDFGATVILRGIQGAFARAACLLLAGIMAAHLLRLAQLVKPEPSLRFMKIATVSVAFWWLAIAHGYASLDNMFDLIFFVGCAWLLVTLFRKSERADATGVLKQDI